LARRWNPRFSPEELDSTVWGFPLEHRRGVFGCRILSSVVLMVARELRMRLGVWLGPGSAASVLWITGCVNKSGSRSFYKLRRGVMVRMRRAESLVKAFTATVKDSNLSLFSLCVSDASVLAICLVASLNLC
ncbi:hypothetical protein IGI04_005091, partial [Brassica rapa subsp. trilocularis]